MSSVIINPFFLLQTANALVESVDQSEAVFLTQPIKPFYIDIVQRNDQGANTKKA